MFEEDHELRDSVKILQKKVNKLSIELQESNTHRKMLLLLNAECDQKILLLRKALMRYANLKHWDSEHPGVFDVFTQSNNVRYGGYWAQEALELLAKFDEH